MKFHALPFLFSVLSVIVLAPQPAKAAPLDPDILITSENFVVIENDPFAPVGNGLDLRNYFTLPFTGNASRDHRFLIWNLGLSSLHLGAIPIQYGGNVESFFFVDAPPSSHTLSFAGFTSVTMRFDPPYDGPKVLNLYFNSDDPDTPQYIIRLGGVADDAASTSVPDLEVGAPIGLKKKPKTVSINGVPTSVTLLKGKVKVTNIGTEIFTPVTSDTLSFAASDDSFLHLSGTAIDPIALTIPIKKPIKPGKKKTFKFKIPLQTLPPYVFMFTNLNGTTPPHEVNFSNNIVRIEMP